MRKNRKRKPIKPDKKPGGLPTGNDLSPPKRGAFPTPKEEIDRATPYIPCSNKVNGDQHAESNVPPDTDAAGR
jgi:hypothetical protein